MSQEKDFITGLVNEMQDTSIRDHVRSNVETMIDGRIEDFLEHAGLKLDEILYEEAEKFIQSEEIRDLIKSKFDAFKDELSREIDEFLEAFLQDKLDSRFG